MHICNNNAEIPDERLIIEKFDCGCHKYINNTRSAIWHRAQYYCDTHAPKTIERADRKLREMEKENKEAEITNAHKTLDTLIWMTKTISRLDKDKGER